VSLELVSGLISRSETNGIDKEAQVTESCHSS